MPRYLRNTAILAKIETTAGVDAVPTGAANALLVRDVSITPLESQNVDRAIIRPYFGASEQLVGPGSVRVGFTVELSGSGTAGTAPAWGALFQACAFAEAVLATPGRVEYTPITDSPKTATIYYHDSGVLHKLLGAMGTWKLEAMANGIPVLQFDFVGVDGGISAVAQPSVTLTAWKTPVVISPSTAVDITLGATYAAGVLTGGSVLTSTGISLDGGNKPVLTRFVSTQRIDNTDRQVSGKIELELTAAQEVSNFASVKANTLQSLAFTIGTTAGAKIMLHMPAVQLINPTKSDRDGVRTISYDLRVTPTSAGNDEVRIVNL